MEHQTVGLFAMEEETSKLLNKIVKQRISEKAQDEKKKLVENDMKLYDLPPDCLEKIASYLNVRAKLNMLYSNKRVYSKVAPAPSSGSISVSWRDWTNCGLSATRRSTKMTRIVLPGQGSSSTAMRPVTRRQGGRKFIREASR